MGWLAKGPIEGGLDRTHVAAGEVAERRRDAVAVLARGNLAAYMCEEYNVDPRKGAERDPAAVRAAADAWADLAKILGLGAPGAAVVGYCQRLGCDSRIPKFRQRSPGAHDRRYCSVRCTALAAAAPAVGDDGPAWAPAPSTAEATCLYCHRPYRPVAGRLPAHPGWERRDGVWFRLSVECPGSGKEVRA